MSTITVALIVLICTVLFGGVVVSRSYSEGFEDASGNKISTSQPAQQVLAKPAADLMVPSMQMQMQPSMYPMQMQPSMYPMQMQPSMYPMPMQPPMMEPVSLPFDAQILLPIQSPTFNQYRTTAAMQLQGAPYGQMTQMPQMAEMPANFTPKKLDEQPMLLDKAMQAALEGDMAAAASFKQAASLIGRG
jgi:hypothetical protein